MSSQNGLRINTSTIVQSVVSVLLVGMILGGINLHGKVSAMEKATETTSEDHDKIIKIEKDVAHIREKQDAQAETNQKAHDKIMDKLDEMQKEQRNGGREGPR